MAGAVYALFAVIYKQQATSLIETSSTIGKVANVLSVIPPNGSGEIGLQVEARLTWWGLAVTVAALLLCLLSPAASPAESFSGQEPTVEDALRAAPAGICVLLGAAEQDMK